MQQQRQQPGRLVTILPGSRTQEVTKNLPWFLLAVEKLQESVPDVHFAVASFNQRQAEIARQLVTRSQAKAEVYCGKTTELIQLAHSCLACSGSVSLELLYHQKPTVIQYRIGRTFYHFLRVSFRLFQIRVKYITLVNMLADEPFADRPQAFDPSPDMDKALFPEFPTCTDKTVWIVRYLEQWLTDPHSYEQRVSRLGRLKAQIAHGGASLAAARYILNQLGKRCRTVPQPHFLPALTDQSRPVPTGMVDAEIAR